MPEFICPYKKEILREAKGGIQKVTGAMVPCYQCRVTGATADKPEELRCDPDQANACARDYSSQIINTIATGAQSPSDGPASAWDDNVF